MKTTQKKKTFKIPAPMQKKNTPTLDIKPVAWNNDKVIKYQAMVRFPERDAIRIIAGQPKPTQSEALDSLDRECDKWTERAKEAKEIIKNQ